MKIACALALLLTGCATGPRVLTSYMEPYRTGGYHIGVDLEEPVGTPVRAARDGRVVWAQTNDGVVAARITIDHEYKGRDYQTQYYHIADPLVKQGQYVKQGDVIARLALTGVRGPNDSRDIDRAHLHLELYVDSIRKDPERAVKWSCITKDKPNVEWLWPVGCD